MHQMLTRLSRIALIAFAAILAGCATVHKEAASLNDANGGNVIVIGRVELVPPLRKDEQNIKLGTFDPFDAKGGYLGRIVLHLADAPMEREKTSELFNPRLEETFFYSIPKESRYVVEASVMMRARTSVVSRRQVYTETAELLLPVPMELDIRPSDTAIYIGTLRVHRDEFNEVTKVELLDHSSKATAEFKNKFGRNAAFRKAPLKING